MRPSIRWWWRSVGTAACLAVLGCWCSPPDDEGGSDNGRPPDSGDGTADDTGAADDGAPRDDAGWDRGDTWPGDVTSYIWIANSREGTLSKLRTEDGVEVGRFITSPQGAAGDPSRTSVNLHGDAVVTNRSPASGPSSVTKFAAEPENCVDRDRNGTIDTSTGGTDVRPWGEDECMLWNTPLPNASATTAIGARATAWDGQESVDTGAGGHVWIGAHNTGEVFQLDGETGAVLATTTVTNMPYGGAMDGRRNFWIVWGITDLGCLDMDCVKLARVNTDTLAVDYYEVQCGYGIAVDSQDRVWTSGVVMRGSGSGSCVSRLDQDTGDIRAAFSTRPAAVWRGLAVDNAGSVWIAETAGEVVQVDEEDVSIVSQFEVGPDPVVGMAIDYQGYVWAVSQGGNAALKIDPRSHEVQSFPVGRGPYTYSDMTGFQLHTVIIF
jgi:streptogramin lyase